MTEGRAALASKALSSFLTDRLGFKFFPQWRAKPEQAKDELPLGCVTVTGAEAPELEGTEELEEPADGSSEHKIRLGWQRLQMQIDVWARGLDERSEIQASMEALWDEANDGDLFVQVGPSLGRFMRGEWRFTDSEESVASREWRLTMQVDGDVDVVATEYAPPMDIRVRIRREEDWRNTPQEDGIPEGNEFGRTLTRDTFIP